MYTPLIRGTQSFGVARIRVTCDAQPRIAGPENSAVSRPAPRNSSLKDEAKPSTAYAFWKTTAPAEPWLQISPAAAAKPAIVRPQASARRRRMSARITARIVATTTTSGQTQPRLWTT